MGFGHRVYKNYDPRARIIKQVAVEVLEVTGRSPLLDMALELERIALEDDYFVSRKLYPNVDFYSGIIYQAMGFPSTCSPCCLPSPAHPMVVSVGRADLGSRAEDRAAAPGLPRQRCARLCTHGDSGGVCGPRCGHPAGPYKESTTLRESLEPRPVCAAFPFRTLKAGR